ncbi:hypothetical protein [Pseudonocardia sp.]|uniref:hypothetical protein n=1 Tax=Pseudonocardia sp. TaxID=60912 RepID=UPI003D0EA938
MNRSIWRTAAVAACLVLAAVPSCASAGATQPPPAAPAGAAADAAGEVDRWARERFPQLYAGVATEDARVLVYRKPSAEFDAALRELRLPAPTVPLDAPYSAPELEALASRVVADIPYWREQGIDVMSVGARYDGTAVDVGTPQPERLAPLLPGRYGTTPPAQAEAIGPITN